MTGLADVIIGGDDGDGRTPRLRQGVVTQVSPLLVRVGSATTAAPASALAGYAPTVGDVVSVLTVTGDRLVLGRAGAAGASAWTALTLLNGYTTESGVQGAQYRIVGDMVQVRGSITRSTYNPGFVANLPAGFRPPAQLRTVAHAMVAGVGQIFMIRSDVYPNGDIYVADIYPTFSGVINLFLNYSFSATP